MNPHPLLSELSRSGRRGVSLPAQDIPQAALPPDALLRRQAARLPELSELDVVRHFTRLSQLNFSIDTHFYPLGSCTMKYNPRYTDQAAQLRGLNKLHPWLSLLPQTQELCQSGLEIISRLENLLCEITGMDAATTQPLAGAHGEMLGIMLIDAYHRSRGSRKKKIIVPDSSHGTNPASAAAAGYNIVTIPSLPNGELDIQALKENLDQDTAALMLTCPNTLGIFEHQIDEISRLAHDHDCLLYYDGANLNAILGQVRPGDIGFDVVHINTHKTFATPHGGGGPGAGPVAVKAKLAPFLPLPRIIQDGKGCYQVLTEDKQSVGQIAPFFGNFGVLVRALAYILLQGREGLLRVSETAVLNAKYIKARLKDLYELPYQGASLHECVFSASAQSRRGVSALDIAKYLLDQGMHAPTVYFPLIVKEALMIEPTETESRETLDRFIEAMREADRLSREDPDSFHSMPRLLPVSRPDEAQAARQLRLRETLD